MPSPIKRSALPQSGSRRLRNPTFRCEIALHTPILLKSPTSHSVAFYLLSLNQVQPLSLKAFISGELTWQQGGFLSSELSIKASGIMCQLALFRGIFVSSFRQCYGMSRCLLPGCWWNDSNLTTRSNIKDYKRLRVILARNMPLFELITP